MDQFIQDQFEAIAVGLFVFGAVLGLVLDVWSLRMCDQFCEDHASVNELLDGGIHFNA